MWPFKKREIVIESVPVFDAEPPPRLVAARDATRLKATKVTRKLAPESISEWGRSARGNYLPCFYDLSKMWIAYETEGLFARAIDKYVAMTWKNGYSFIGPQGESEAVKYIRYRFDQIAMVTGIPTDDLLTAMGFQVWLYGNSIVSKTRDILASGGRRRKTFTGKELVPVAGYFAQDPRWVHVDLGISGVVRGYKLAPPTLSRLPTHLSNFGGLLSEAREIIWAPDNVIHIPLLLTGRPFSIPPGFQALNDIHALRDVEEKYIEKTYLSAVASPHIKVGTDRTPGTVQDVETVRSYLQNTPPGGALVTNNTVEVGTSIQHNSEFDMGEAVHYWMKRIAMDMGTSTLGLGDPGTANRSSGEVLIQEVQGAVKYAQRRIKTYVDNFMIRELLLEGGYNYDTNNPDSKVELFIPEIDEESQFRESNRVMLLFTSNLITEDEARGMLGLSPMREEWRAQTYANLYGTAIRGAQGASNTAATVLQPQNQGKKLSAPPKVTKRDSLPPLGMLIRAAEASPLMLENVIDEWCVTEDAETRYLANKVREMLNMSDGERAESYWRMWQEFVSK